MESKFDIDRRIISRWLKKGDLILGTNDKRFLFKTKPLINFLNTHKLKNYSSSSSSAVFLYLLFLFF